MTGKEWEAIMAVSTKGPSQAVKVAEARRRPLSKTYVAKARKAGHLDFAAAMLGVDMTTLLKKGVTKSGVWHAADIGTAIERRSIVARNVRSMEQADFERAITDGSFAFLASIWQCKTTATFSNMRKSDVYGREARKAAKAEATTKATKAEKRTTKRSA